jgi:proteasome lid subunit RPN8/RPN11
VNRSIRVPQHILDAMLAHAQREPNVECCGLLAGRDGVIRRIFPAANAAENPVTSYEIAPKEIFDLMREMRAEDIEMLGIYHSHPNGKNEPSPRDIDQAYYSEAAYFIISPLGGAKKPVRAFWICDGQVTELPIQIT